MSGLDEDKDNDSDESPHCKFHGNLYRCVAKGHINPRINPWEYRAECTLSSHLPSNRL